MTFLDDKSIQYVDQLNEIVEEYKEKNPLLIKIFCKYADAEFGSIDSRKGIFTLLSESTVGLLIQEDLPYLILNPTAYHNAKTSHLGDLDFKSVKKEVLKDKLDRIEKLLWIESDPWYTAIGEVRAIWIASGTIWIRSIDPKLPGYSFRDFNLRKDWEDIYDKESVQSTQ